MIALVGAALALGPAPALVEWDLDADDGGFASGGETGQWAWGAVTHGPGSGWDGPNAWSTGLTADTLNDATDWLELPLPDLGGAGRPVLRFVHYLEIGAGDVARVEIDRGNGWEVAEPIYGYPAAGGFVGSSGGWAPVAVDLVGALAVRLVLDTDLAGVGAGWTIDAVGVYDGDVVGPSMAATRWPADTDDLDGPYVVELFATDDVAVSAVSLSWAPRGRPAEVVEMLPVGAGVWRGTIPGQAADTTVSWWVDADDGLNTSTLRGPDFRVALPAPTDLTAPEGRIVATSARLTWTPPESVHEVLDYVVLRGDTTVATVTEPAADVPLLEGYDRFSVRARYAAGLGDRSAEVAVDAAVPGDVTLLPSVLGPGERVRVALRGGNLFLVDGDVEVSLGAGVVVESVDVRDVGLAWVTAYVSPEARPGDRDLVLRTPAYTLDVEGALTIDPSSSPPAIVALSPDAVRQGERGVLRVTIEGALDLSRVPLVDLGDGVVVEGVTVVTVGASSALDVAYAVTPDAALGGRNVELDDGTHLVTGGVVEVRDNRVADAGGCASVGGGSALGAAAAGLLVASRRRRR